MNSNIVKRKNIKKKVGRGFSIKNDNSSASDLIDEFQYWLHCSSIRLDRLKGPKSLVEVLKKLTKLFENELPYELYNLFAIGVVKLFQNIISKKCAYLTLELIEAACDVWTHPNMIRALGCFSGDTCYGALLDEIFIESLGTTRESFHKLELLITTLINNYIVTWAYVNKRFKSISNYKFNPVALAEISNMQKSILKATTEYSIVEYSDQDWQEWQD